MIFGGDQKGTISFDTKKGLTTYDGVILFDKSTKNGMTEIVVDLVDLGLEEEGRIPSHEFGYHPSLV
jgi:hypothetical protein